MARSAKSGPNKSQFIRDMLGSNKNVKHKEVAEAWKKAGNSDEIKSTLYYLVKSKLKGKRGRKLGAAHTTAESPVGEKDAVLLEMERMLDKLIAMSASARESKLAEDLRIARRRVSAMLV